MQNLSPTGADFAMKGYISPVAAFIDVGTAFGT
jgi:hypothetical protein